MPSSFIFARISSVAFFLVCCPYVQAQYAWFNEYTGNGSVDIADLANTPDDFLYAVGNYSDGVSIDNDHPQAFGSFLIKLNEHGDVIWTEYFTFEQTDFRYLSHVESDGQGNAYVSGQYGKSAVIGGSTITSSVFGSYVAKFNKDGVLLWIKSYPLVQDIFQMDVNLHGDVAISAMLGSPVIFEGLSMKGPGFFGAVYNTDGNLRWIRNFNSEKGFMNFSIAVTLDEQGNAYFCGRYTGNGLGDLFVNTGKNNYAMVFMKINAFGEFLWHREAQRDIFPGMDSDNPPNGLINESGVLTTDSLGNLYILVEYWQSIMFQSGGVGDGNILLNENNLHLNSVDSDGNESGWAYALQNHAGSMKCYAIVHRDQKIYIAGTHNSALYYSVFDNGSDFDDYQKTFPISNFGKVGMVLNNKNEMFFCGTKNQDGTDRKTGYIFKLGVQPVLHISCEGADLILTTGTQSLAVKYLWEVSQGNVTNVFETTPATLEIDKKQLNEQSPIRVRVRAVYPDGSGDFSAWKTLPIPKPAPKIQGSCDEIKLIEGDSVRWYHDDVPLQEVEPGVKVIRPLKTGAYYATVQNTCEELKSNIVFIRHLGKEAGMVPNVITPNGDLFNETFIIDGSLTGSSISVFSRWGKLVFQTDNYQNDWSAQNLPAGIYFYEIKNECLTVKGTLSVMK